MKKTVILPGHITPDQFGVDKQTFDKYFKGKELEVQEVTTLFTNVTTSGLPETYSVHNDDLKSKNL